MVYQIIALLAILQCIFMDLLAFKDVQPDIIQAIIFAKYVLQIVSIAPLQFSAHLAKHHTHYMEDIAFKPAQIKLFQCRMD